MALELISFAICPYVQRSVITLQEKGIEFDTTYIELDNPPSWFLKISPFGKVPVLRVDDEVIFESAVINEYLDEVHPPPMHPADPLTRAQNRAWIEFGSALLVDQYGMMVAQDEAEFERHRTEAQAKLARIEPQLGEGPYFNGTDYALIDAAYTPLFQRFEVLERAHPLELFDHAPRVQAWSRALCERPSTHTSVPDDFETAFKDYIRQKNGYIAGYF